MAHRTLIEACLLVLTASTVTVLAADYVVLISIDGLHASDLEWASKVPGSTLEMLSKAGTTFTNAYIQSNSDSFPGVLALTAGANPKSTGVYYDDSYSRNLWAPGTKCTNGMPEGPPGAEMIFDETIDIDLTNITGGGNSMGVGSINPANLPLDANCTPVYPHQFVRTNTVFEVAKAGGLLTAWTDKHPAYDLLNGPSGKGIDQLYTPEINSDAPGGTIWTDPAMTPAYDTLHTNAMINWIAGKDWAGNSVAGWATPNLLGGNYQSVSTAQKIYNGTYKGGYLADGETPNAMLASSLGFVDKELGRIMTALKAAGVAQDTTVIVTAKHGQSPKQASKTRLMPASGNASIPGVLQAMGIEVAQATQDDVSLLWLKDSNQSAAAAAVLRQNAGMLGIQTVLEGKSLKKAGWAGNPKTDPRAPDIVCQVVPGVIYVGDPANPSKWAEHGGLAQDDRHVGLLVWGKGVKKAGMSHKKVYTTQVATSVLRLLGLSPQDLDGVKLEKTKHLPGLNYAS